MIKVLIIEDDPMVAKFNHIYLQKVSGFEGVGVAHNVAEGWTFLNEHSVDLILLDIYMAETTGLEMLIELRKMGNNVDVIVITAANDNQSVQKALHYGAVDYLIKPFDFERFQESLLQYRQKFEMMQQENTFRQEDVDSIILSRRPQSDPYALPKGLTFDTLSKIAKEIVKWEGSMFSTAELSEVIGVSQVSTRKYLQYMTEVNVLLSNLSYEGGGRPLQQYKMNPEKVDTLYSFIKKSE